ncbi:hypothetical protein QUF90_26265 [Desulfococcaceae bacterium HSG9]|nr:hypothetical protein [Desulfococcaceae bacterium HSG9]
MVLEQTLGGFPRYNLAYGESIVERKAVPLRGVNGYLAAAILVFDILASKLHYEI